MKLQSADSYHLHQMAVAHTHRYFVSSKAPFTLQLLLRVADVSNRTGIKYPCVTTDSRKKNINNIYIIYTFLSGDYLASLLVLQLLGTVAFPVTITLAVEAHNARFGLGSLRGHGNWLSALLWETPFASLA